jgi:RHS repeat-associated protein
MLGDHLGSTSVTWRNDGADTRRQRYLPYGTPRGTGVTLPTERTYTGQTKDPSTGLMYYGARYYDPAVGRFASADTIAPGLGTLGLNRYTYANDNPVRYNDPTGHLSADACERRPRNCGTGKPAGYAPTPSTRDRGRPQAVRSRGGGPNKCAFACTAQGAVDAISGDPDGLGGLVFGIIDVAHQGDTGRADGNWNEKDIDAAIDGGDLLGIISALGIDGRDAQGLKNLVQHVARLLKPHHDLWESIDKDPRGGVTGFVSRNWRTATALAAVAACATGAGCVVTLLAGFAARSIATTYTHGFSMNSALTIGLDATITSVGLMTAGTSNSMLGPMTLNSGAVMAPAVTGLSKVATALLPGTAGACAVLCPYYVER